MSKIEDLDLVTSVELTNVSTREKNKEKDCYHFLYGSQIYGTLFGIFGQFVTASVPKKDALEVRSLKMKILNYQGLLNIGFSCDEPKFDVSEKILFVGVQGASQVDEKTAYFEPGQVIVKKGVRKRLIVERVLYPLNGFPASSEPDAPLGPPNQRDRFFDTEFEYRNGVDHFPQYWRMGMAKPDGSHRAKGREFPSIRCVQSNINLYYY